MSSELRRLLDSERPLHRLAPEAVAPACDRLWPLADGGWLGRVRDLAADTPSFWGIAKPRGRFPKALTRLFEQGRGVWLLELEAIAWRVGDDPAVGRVTDGVLHPYSSRADLAKFEHLRGDLVGYKPLRRAVARFDDPSGTPRAYAKYLRRGHAARIAESNNFLASWTEVNRGFAVPRLIDLHLDPDMLVWQPASGSLLSNLLFAPRCEDAGTLIDRIGRVVANLHLCPPRVLPRHDRQRELDTLRTWLEIGRHLVGDRGALDSAYAALVDYEGRLTTHPGVVCHRDLHDGQLLVDDDRITLLDADTIAIGEPELDLGNLLAHLDWNGLNRGDRRWRELARPLVAAYCEVVASSIDWDRLHWYRAAAAVRLACVHAGRFESREQASTLTGWAHQQIDLLESSRREAV